MKPSPNRNAPIASGSTACLTKRVAPIDVPPSPLDSTADSTPQISPIEQPSAFVVADKLATGLSSQNGI